MELAELPHPAFTLAVLPTFMSNDSLSVDLQEGYDYLTSIGVSTPDVAIVLGSGLGQIAASVNRPTVIATKNVPNYPVSTAPGHEGRLIWGDFEENHVMIIQGRVHVYEGYSARQAAFPMQLASALGASRLIVTNAAGGINPSFSPGTLMLIKDHINLTFDDPLNDDSEDGRSHLSGVCIPYDEAWIEQVKNAVLGTSIVVQEGVYLWTKGPSYETKAEIQAFSRMGADAVGMSTVPEALQAYKLGMKVLGISTITNYAAGLSPILLKHEDVLDVGKQIQSTLVQLLRIILQRT